jgi:hypothetical protein
LPAGYGASRPGPRGPPSTIADRARDRLAACARPLEDVHHLQEALAARVGKRSNSFTVGEVDVGTGADEQADDLGVAVVAAAEDNRLEQRRPVEAVDVIDVDRCFEQSPHDRNMAAIGGTDEPGAVVGVLGVDIGPVGQGQLEQPRVVADLAGCDQVGALLSLVLDVDVGTGVDQQACGLDVVAVGGGDKRVAPLASRASTVAPRSSSERTSATSPVRAAEISSRSKEG